MPNFNDDKPVTIRQRSNTPGTPGTPPTVGTPPIIHPPGPGDATVAHMQYNSPMGMYSNDSVKEAFVGQTDGLVTGVAGSVLSNNHTNNMPANKNYSSNGLIWFCLYPFAYRLIAPINRIPNGTPTSRQIDEQHCLPVSSEFPIMLSKLSRRSFGSSVIDIDLRCL